MVSVDNFRPKLRELLCRTDAPDLVSNAAWVTATASAPRQRYLRPADILLPILHLLSKAYIDVSFAIPVRSYVNWLLGAIQGSFGHVTCIQ